MQNLYDEALRLAEEVKSARLNVLKQSKALAELSYKLNVKKSKIERGLIKQVGDEKRLGPSLDSRERVFVLARDADADYIALYEQVENANELLETAKITVEYLEDKMTIMLTAMRTKSSP